jgi:hypothetical protein
MDTGVSITGGKLGKTLKAHRAKKSKKPSRSGKIIGSRIQVYRGNATHTTGRLTKDDLIRNQHGRIVSKKRHEQGKTAIQYLEKGGYKGVLPSKRSKKSGSSMTGGSCNVFNAELPSKFQTGPALTGGCMSGSGDVAVDPDQILDK